MKKTLSTFAIAAGLTAIGWCAPATAQFNQNNQNNTNTGTGGAATASGSSAPFGNLSGGSGPFGNLSGGSGAQSSGGMGSSIFGGITSGGLLGGAAGDLLGAAGLSSVLGQSQNRNTVGGAMGQMGGRTGMGTAQGGTTRGGQANRTTQMGGNMGAGARSQVPVRTKLTIGFAYAPTPPSAVISRLEQSLRTPEIAIAEAPLTVSTTETAQGTVAVLRGTVESSEARLLAEQLALLEPGIWNVQNELAVAPSPAPPAPPAVEPLPPNPAP